MWPLYTRFTRELQAPAPNFQVQNPHSWDPETRVQGQRPQRSKPCPKSRIPPMALEAKGSTPRTQNLGTRRRVSTQKPRAQAPGRRPRMRGPRRNASSQSPRRPPGPDRSSNQSHAIRRERAAEGRGIFQIEPHLALSSPALDCKIVGSSNVTVECNIALAETTTRATETMLNECSRNASRECWPNWQHL